MVDPTSVHHGNRVDIRIKEGKIVEIGNGLDGEEQKVEGEGQFVSSGWVDVMANFCDPGEEFKEDLDSGCAAAAAGGFTDVVLAPNTTPPIDSKNDIQYILKHNIHSLTQLHPLGAITLGCRGEELTEMIDLHHTGAVGFTDGINPVWNTDILVKALQYVQFFNGLVIDRPEDRWMSALGLVHEGTQSTLIGLKGIPSVAEELMVQRDIQLLKYAGGRLHLSSISTAGAVELIRKAKDEGLNITCDVAAINLRYDEEVIKDFDTNFKVKPPFRTYSDREALKRGVQDGTIDLIVSSHQPQDSESKNLEFDLADYGIAGIQTFIADLIASDLGPVNELIGSFTHKTREIFGLEKCSIEVDQIATLTVFSPEQSWNFSQTNAHSKSHNNPLLGKEIKGKVICTINNHQIRTYDEY